MSLQEDLVNVELEATPAEASDLLEVEDVQGLERLGWDAGFWTVLDDVPVERGIALVGHARGAAPTEGWELRHVRVKPDGKKGSTEDAEACARHDGFVYVFGSHFGSKEGPLERERSFVARFEESELERPARGKKVRLELVRESFLLHRILNDALADFGPELLELDEEVERRFVGDLRKRADKKDKPWAKRIHPGDRPLNIEGAAFRPGGSLLLGLRFPVTSAGEPLIAEIEGIADLFHGRPHGLRVRAVWVLEGVGSRDAPEGVRALRLLGSELHAVTGSLDSVDKDSLLLANHPEGAAARCDHRSVKLPRAPARDRAGTRWLASRVIRSFPRLRNVEGLGVLPGGGFAYVTDEEECIELRLAP